MKFGSLPSKRRVKPRVAETLFLRQVDRKIALLQELNGNVMQ
jgi:hypothetical protein